MGWNNYTVTNSYQGGADPVDSILISETYEPDFVYQRDGAGNATAEFSVSYTSSPVDLYYRLLGAEDDSVVVGWTVFDTVTVEGSGTSALSITRPSSTTYYKVEVRLGTSGPTSIQSDAWAIGVKVGFIGQSLIEHLGTQDQSGTPDHVRKFAESNGFFISTQGAGQAECAKRLVEIHGCVVAICNTAVGDTVLTEESASTGGRGSNYWNNPNSSLWLNTMSALERFAPDGRVEFVAWMQGGSDATQGVDYGIYENDLREFLSRVRDNFLDKDGGNDVPIVIGTLGRSGSSTNANRQGIRAAIYNVVEDDSTLLPIPVYPYGTDDRTHPNDAGDLSIGLSIADVSNGERAPRFSASAIEGSVITLTYDQDLLASDTNYSTEGVRVEVNGESVGVSAFTRSGSNQTEIALDETPSDVSDVSVYVCYGSGTGSSLLTYPKSASNGLFTIPVISKNNDFSANANQPPTANAGPDQSVAAGARVQLNATLSTDPEDGSISQFGWEQVDNGADAVVLEFANTAKPEFTAPSSLTAQTLEFRVQAQDSEGATSTDTVIINVAALEENAILSTMETLDFELVTQGNLVAYKGRANREVMQLKPSSTSGIVTTGGYLDVSNNGIVKVEIIADGKKISNENSDSIKIDGARILARLGDLDIPTSGRDSITPTFMIVLYVGSDTRGLVVASNATSGYKPLSYRVEDAA